MADEAKAIIRGGHKGPAIRGHPLKWIVEASVISIHGEQIRPERGWTSASIDLDRTHPATPLAGAYMLPVMGRNLVPISSRNQIVNAVLGSRALALFWRLCHRSAHRIQVGVPSAGQ